MIRFGVLGVARVVPYGLVDPARKTAGVEVQGVASRMLSKAQAFAGAHGIPQAFGSDEELLDDPGIDAVYIALPTALHPEWVRRSLEAGKHVLCEKPLTSDPRVAQDLVSHAQQHNRVLHEAMHVRYLPKLLRQRELVASGDFGAVRRIESCFRLPRVPMSDGDFRLRYESGGGAGLDLGCYAVTCLRYVAGEEPKVVSARCRRAAPQVDRWMRVTCRFPSGATGIAQCGFRGWYAPRLGVEVECERGWIKWAKDGLTWKQNGRVVHETIPDGWTYQRQIEAFANSANGDASTVIPPEDAVANARVLDDMYAAAGLAPRPTTMSA